MRINIFRYTSFLALLAIGMQSCKKEPTAIPPSVSEFVGTSPGSFFVMSSGSQFKIPVGISAVSSMDRTINYTVTSPTGAASGVQYTIPKTSVTIPAGKAIDSITINGIFAGFPGSRRDTLVFTLASGGDVQPSSFANTYRVVMQKYCDVSLPAFAGTYTKSFDIEDADQSNVYGPYGVDITSGVVSGTTGYILVDNFGDYGTPSIRINLDWTSPGNFTTSVPDQFLYVDSRYGNARIRSAGTGTFSACDRTFTIKYEMYVSAGSFGKFTTTIAR
jgi:hypothetical protein